MVEWKRREAPENDMWSGCNKNYILLSFSVLDDMWMRHRVEEEGTDQLGQLFVENHLEIGNSYWRLINIRIQ